jgi:hypothetical protein
MEQSQPAHGMRTFFTIWSGQLASLLGSQFTGFALGVWVYDQTKSVMLLALVQVAQQTPYVLLSPIAGVFADRWNRRTAMIVSDFGAGLAVLAAGGLYLTHHLQPGWTGLLLPAVQPNPIQLPLLPQPSLPKMPERQSPGMAGETAGFPAACPLLHAHLHHPCRPAPTRPQSPGACL